MASDADRRQKLFEAALCTTICVRVLGVGSSGGLAAMAELSNRFAERLRAETKVAMDSFVTFADKVWLMSGDKTPDLQTLQSKGVRFNGGDINVTMLRTIISLKKALTPQARSVLGLLDREFGREVLSMSYNKIRLLLQQVSVCSKGGEGGDPASEVLEWVLASLWASLRRKEAEPAQFTVETFTKGRQGEPSWIALAAMQRLIVMHVATIFRSFKECESELAARIDAEIMPCFASPMARLAAFPPAKAKAEDDDDAPLVAEEPDAALTP